MNGYDGSVGPGFFLCFIILEELNWFVGNRNCLRILTILLMDLGVDYTFTVLKAVFLVMINFIFEVIILNMIHDYQFYQYLNIFKNSALLLDDNHWKLI